MTLKHVQTVRRGACVYRYLRIPGAPRVRLLDLPVDDPEFLAAYASALQTEPKQTRAKAGTVAAMVESYMRSEAHADHSASCLRIISRHAEAIRKAANDALMRHLKPEHIQDDLRGLTPMQGRDRMKT